MVTLFKINDHVLSVVRTYESKLHIFYKHNYQQLFDVKEK